MAFASFGFFAFLAATWLAWRLLGRTPAARRAVLLAASGAFYCTFDVRFAAALAWTIVSQWWIGERIAAAKSDAGRRNWLRASVALALLTLAWFKYVKFFAAELRALLERLGAGGGWLDASSIVAPIGISFFTFQALTYTIDLRHRRIERASLPGFALFLSFFASVTSGPITRARQLLPQLEASSGCAALPAEALFLIVRGLVKKVAFADVLAASFVDPAFAEPGAWSRGFLAASLVAYSFQIYMDLSGYTDLARGVARCFGYELAANFDRPYLARTISGFWQRWHQTMSGFFRETFYFALGGSRRGNVYVHLLVTFVAIGLWHGAGWNFVAYGLLHGGAVCLERWRRKRREALGVPEPVHGVMRGALALLLTFSFVAVARVLFVAADLHAAGDYVRSMLVGDGSGGASGPQGVVTLLAAIALHFAPRRLELAARERFLRLPALLQGGLLCAVVYALVALAAAPRAFVYFQF